MESFSYVVLPTARCQFAACPVALPRIFPKSRLYPKVICFLNAFTVIDIYLASFLDFP
jgi:hypothetical protein